MDIEDFGVSIQYDKEARNKYQYSKIDIFEEPIILNEDGVYDSVRRHTDLLNVMGYRRIDFRNDVTKITISPYVDDKMLFATTIINNKKSDLKIGTDIGEEDYLYWLQLRKSNISTILLQLSSPLIIDNEDFVLDLIPELNNNNIESDVMYEAVKSHVLGQLNIQEGMGLKIENDKLIELNVNESSKLQMFNGNKQIQMLTIQNGLSVIPFKSEEMNIAFNYDLVNTPKSIAKYFSYLTLHNFIIEGLPIKEINNKIGINDETIKTIHYNLKPNESRGYGVLYNHKIVPVSGMLRRCLSNFSMVTLYTMSYYVFYAIVSGGVIIKKEFAGQLLWVVFCYMREKEVYRCYMQNVPIDLDINVVLSQAVNTMCIPFLTTALIILDPSNVMEIFQQLNLNEVAGALEEYIDLINIVYAVNSLSKLENEFSTTDLLFPNQSEMYLNGILEISGDPGIYSVFFDFIRFLCKDYGLIIIDKNESNYFKKLYNIYQLSYVFIKDCNSSYEDEFIALTNNISILSFKPSNGLIEVIGVDLRDPEFSYKLSDDIVYVSGDRIVENLPFIENLSSNIRILKLRLEQQNDSLEKARYGNTSLGEERNYLEKAIKEMEILYLNLGNQYGKLQLKYESETDQFMKQIEEDKRRLDQVVREMNDRDTVINQLREERNGLINELNTANLLIEKLNNDVRKSTEKYKKIESQLDEIESSDDDDNNDKRKPLTGKIKRVNDIKQLQKMLIAEQDVIYNLSEQTKIGLEEKDKKEQELNGLEKEVERLNFENEQLLAQIENLTIQNKNNRIYDEIKYSKLKAEYEEVKKEMKGVYTKMEEEFIKQKDKFNSAKQISDNEIDKLMEENDLLKNEIQSLKVEIETANEKMDEAFKEMVDLDEGSINEIRKAMKFKVSKILENTEEMNNENESVYDDIKSLMIQNSALLQSIDEKDKIINELQIRLKESVEQVKELTNRITVGKQKVRNLNKVIEEKNEKMENIMQATIRSTDIISQRESEIETLKKWLSDIGIQHKQGEIASSIEEQSLLERLNLAEVELSELRALKLNSDNNYGLEKQVEELKNIIEDTIKERDDALENVITVQQRIDRDDVVIKRLNEEIQNLTEVIFETERKLKDQKLIVSKAEAAVNRENINIQNELDERDEKITLLKEEMNTLEFQNNIMKNEFDKLRREKISKTNDLSEQYLKDIDTLKQSISLYERKIVQLEEELVKKTDSIHTLKQEIDLLKVYKPEDPIIITPRYESYVERPLPYIKDTYGK